MKDKKCKVCGDSFIGKHSSHIYCSDLCYKHAKKAKDKARAVTKIMEEDENEKTETLDENKTTEILDAILVPKRLVPEYKRRIQAEGFTVSELISEINYSSTGTPEPVDVRGHRLLKITYKGCRLFHLFEQWRIELR